MAQKKRKGGGKAENMFFNVIWAFFILSLAVAWFKSPVDAETNGIGEWGKAKSAAVEQWVKSWTDGGLKLPSGSPGGIGTGPGGTWTGGGTEGTEGGTGGSGIAPGTSTQPAPETRSKLDTVAIAPAEKVSYNRDEWKHWNTVRNCWDVREEVLVRDAVPASVTYLDKDKKDVSLQTNACYVKSGQWVDYYTGKTFTDPSKLDIDHMIPLSYAAQHGGQGWDAKKKSDYANSMDAGHLVAVSAGENRAKGDKGPSEWKPTDKGSWCQYATDWISVSTKWGLSVTEADKKALSSMLDTCA